MSQQSQNSTLSRPSRDSLTFATTTNQNPKQAPAKKRPNASTTMQTRSKTLHQPDPDIDEEATQSDSVMSKSLGKRKSVSKEDSSQEAADETENREITKKFQPAKKLEEVSPKVAQFIKRLQEKNAQLQRSLDDAVADTTELRTLAGKLATDLNDLLTHCRRSVDAQKNETRALSTILEQARFKKVQSADGELAPIEVPVITQVSGFTYLKKLLADIGDVQWERLCAAVAISQTVPIDFLKKLRTIEMLDPFFDAVFAQLGLNLGTVKTGDTLSANYKKKAASLMLALVVSPVPNVFDAETIKGMISSWWCELKKKNGKAKPPEPQGNGNGMDNVAN